MREHVIEAVAMERMTCWLLPTYLVMYLLPTNLLIYLLTYERTAAASRSTAEATASEEKAYLGLG